MVLANLAEGLLSTMGRVGDHIGPTENWGPKLSPPFSQQGYI
jgi:hypothetical protein